jgi:tetratricopeptide (TPR) repeat protein
MARLELGRENKAIADFTKAIEINPKYAQAYYHRGLTHVQLGNEEEAMADFQKAENLSRQQGNMTLYQNAQQQIQQLQ